MNIVTTDYETRSAVDISVGSWPYAEHSTTSPICLSVKLNYYDTYIYIFEEFRRYINWSDKAFCDRILTTDQLLWYYREADIIEAHNAMFERAMYENKCHRALGWPEIPPEKWKCSAALASAASLPRSLDGALIALNAPIRKDKDGRAAMLRTCKPRAPRAAEKALHPNWRELIFWSDNPEDYQKNFKYNMQDVEAEHWLSNHVRGLSLYESKLWALDQKINANGVKIDAELARSAIYVIGEYEEEMKAKVPKLTGGAVQTVKQNDRAKEWLATKGVVFESLSKDVVKEYYDTYIEGEALTDDLKCVKEFLNLRKLLYKSSTAKFKAMIVSLCADGRFRDMLMYWGANTGRWAGKKIQLQNLPSRDLVDHIDFCIELILRRDLEAIKLYYGDVMKALSSCIRGCLIPAEGMKFLCSDYSSIEGRILAWFAGETEVVEAYVSGLCLYRIAATSIYPLTYDEIDEKSIERKVGKVCELALGYNGGWKAFRRMAKGYGVEPPKNIYLSQDDYYDMDGVTVLKKKDAVFKKWADPIVKAWRDGRQKTTNLWSDLEYAAKKAIHTGEPITCRYVTFEKVGDFLYCLLPSGRVLSYYRPFIKKSLAPWANKENPSPSDYKDTIHFWGVDGETKRWGVKTTYGGKLCENIVQAIARDILAHALLKLDAAGYNPVAHVHDEVLCEVPLSFGTVDALERIMEDTAPWAHSIPISAAGGWEGFRFRK